MTLTQPDAAPPGRPPAPVRTESPLRGAARATALGAALAGMLAAAVAATPLLAPEQRVPGLGGYALAVLSTALGNLALAASLLAPARSNALTRAVVADLALHVGLGGGTALALFLLHTKFLVAATFALAFAAAVIVMRITGAVVLSRALTSAGARREPERRI